MQLIDAVNVTLQALGESLITNINTSNPSAGLAKNTLTLKRRAVLATGWWFNTIERTYTPSSLGKISVPYKQLSIYSADGSKYSVRDSLLYDLVEQTSVFTDAVTLTITLDFDYEDLPEYIAQHLAYDTAAFIYLNDLGRDKNYEELSRMAAMQLSMATREHLRNQQYTMSASTRAAKLMGGFRI